MNDEQKPVASQPAKPAPKKQEPPKAKTIPELEEEYVDLAAKVSDASKKLTLDELSAITRGQEGTTADGKAFAALKVQKAKLTHEINVAKGLV